MQTNVVQIGIIGAGELGQALGKVLTESHVQVLYYDKNPEVTTTPSIEDVVKTCEVLLLCVPSWEVKNVTKQISKAASPGKDHVVIALSKGVESGFKTMDQVLGERLPDFYDYGVLYGPMLAEEITLGRSGGGVLALSKAAWFKILRPVFAHANISVESSGDMRAVSLCAVLKNIYAIAFGICDGLNLGLNVKGKLATMALHEMKRILSDHSVAPHTAEGMAGLGDMLATGFSDKSFNYRIGRSLAERIASGHIKSEGLVTLYELSKSTDLKRYPIASAIDQIVFHYGQPSKLIDLIEQS